MKFRLKHTLTCFIDEETIDSPSEVAQARQNFLLLKDTDLFEELSKNPELMYHISVEAVL